MQKKKTDSDKGSSVRSTNVYEERSLGVFEEEEWHLEGDSRIAIWGNYLLQHSKTQMSFGKP